MSRWAAVLLGCLTGLGMQALFERLGPRAGGAVVQYGEQFLALLLAGYVAGHLSGRWPIFYAALAATVYIFVTATVTAAREVALAREFGPGMLVPLDFGQLAMSDIVALVGASCGGWLSLQGSGSPPRP